MYEELILYAQNNLNNTLPQLNLNLPQGDQLDQARYLKEHYRSRLPFTEHTSGLSKKRSISKILSGFT